MLPPVRAALSSNTDVQSLAPATAARLSLAVPATVPTVDSDVSAPISGGRMDALSLSAQLKLAQSFSIFAETIGKVLNMPRGENEALVDYATRLSEAVRALNPGERMAIERLLNQIVKGVTLRLLAEILNNPAGPDAARLAAYIEAASAGERDLAAKAVVSSYRQNGSTESAASGNVARMQASAGTQAPAGTPVTTTPGANAAASATTVPSHVSLASGPQPSAQNVGQSPAPEQAEGDPPAQPAKNDPRPAAQDNHMERPTTGAARSSPGANGTGAAGRPQASHIVAGATLPGHTGHQAGVAPLPGTAAPLAPSAGDEVDASLARAAGNEAAGAKNADSRTKDPRHAEMGMRLPSASSVDGRAGLSNARLMLAELANWMTDVFSAAEAPAGATTKPTTPAVPASSEQAIQQDEALLPEGAAKQTAGAARSTGSTEAPISRPVESQPTENAAASQPEKAELLERQMAMLGGLPQATREGVPLPYVAYPPGEQEPEREERKTRAIAEIGDEEGDNPAQDHGFHQDQQEQDPEDGNPEENSEKGPADREEAMATANSHLPPDEDEGRPNDLYWRMAGWA